jgi:hypothetical protein
MYTAKPDSKEVLTTSKLDNAIEGERTKERHRHTDGDLRSGKCPKKTHEEEGQRKSNRADTDTSVLLYFD